MLKSNKMTAETRMMRFMTREQVIDVATRILTGNIQDIQRIAQDPESTPLQVWICSVTMKGIKEGDMYILNQLLDRIMGKPTAQVELIGGDGDASRYVDVSTEDLKRKYAQLMGSIDVGG